MDARKYYGVSFVPLEEIASDGRQRKFIDGVEEGKYGKLNLLFTDNTAISLNATNTRALAKALGPETEDWLGHAIDLSVGEIEYQGKPQAAILVTVVESEPVEKLAKPRGDDIDNSSIPF